MPDEATPPSPDIRPIQALVEDLPVPTALLEGPAHRIAYLNPAFGRVLGRATAALLGLPAAEAFPRQAVRGRVPLLDLVRAEGQPVLRRAQPLRLKADEPRFWDLEATPLRNGGSAIVGILLQCRDVTAQQQALRQGEAARATLDALFAHVPEGLAIGDGRQARLSRVSAHGLAMVGRTAAEVIGQGADLHPTTWRVCHPDGSPAAAEELPLARAAAHGELVQNAVWQLRGADGGLIPILCNAGPIRDSAGRVTGGIVAWRDMSEVRRAEDALRKALAAQRMLAREADHRIKNSLQLVAALLRLQSGRAADPATRAALEAATARVRAVAEAHRALQNSADLRSVQLHDMLRDLAAAAAALHPGADIRIIAPEGLSLDAERAIPLALVLSELVTNALKHAYPEGQGGPVYLMAEARGDRLLAVVADDGCGMAEGREGHGSLGETVVRSLARQIGATVRRSANGTGGLRVALDLPLDPAATAEPSPGS